MDWDKRPRTPADMQTAIEQARAEGPTGIARWALLGLWLVGQTDDPRLTYEGPEGVRPLPYLHVIIKEVLKDKAPEFVTYSSNFHLRQKFPPPGPRQQPHTRLGAARAARLIQKAWENAPEDVSTSARAYRLGQSFTELWQRGVSRQQLQPIFDFLSQAAADPAARWYALESLLQIGEWQAVEPWLETLFVPTEEAVKLRIRLAPSLIRINQPERARACLETAWADRTALREDRRRIWLDDFARGWAYLGEVQRARAILRDLDDNLSAQIGVEGILALRDHDQGRPVDPRPLLDFLEQTARIETPKHRAHEQTCILETLLAVGAYEAAWQALDVVRATLLVTPLWVKYELRAINVSAVLWPYLADHTPRIYPYAAALLAHGIESRDSWRMTHTVNALLWLIRGWCGDDGLKGMADFIAAWQKDKAPQPPKSEAKRSGSAETSGPSRRRKAGAA